MLGPAWRSGLTLKTIGFFFEHKNHWNFRPVILYIWICKSCLDGQYPQKVYTLFRPKTSEEIESPPETTFFFFLMNVVVGRLTPRLVQLVVLSSSTGSPLVPPARLPLLSRFPLQLPSPALRPSPPSAGHSWSARTHWCLQHNTTPLHLN
jgi:hypothetical protein